MPPRIRASSACLATSLLAVALSAPALPACSTKAEPEAMLKAAAPSDDPRFHGADPVVGAWLRSDVGDPSRQLDYLILQRDGEYRRGTSASGMVTALGGKWSKEGGKLVLDQTERGQYVEGESLPQQSPLHGARFRLSGTLRRVTEHELILIFRGKDSAYQPMSDSLAAEIWDHPAAYSRRMGQLEKRRSVIRNGIALGNLLGVKRALEGLDVNLRLDDGSASTPLGKAAKYGDPKMVQFLLDQGADPNLADDRGRTPEDIARVSGHDDVLALLAKKPTGATQIIANQLTAAAAFGDVAKVNELLARTSNVDMPAATPDAPTPLIAAAKAGHIDIVRALLRDGADVAKTDAVGKTARDYAREANHVEVTKLLYAPQ